MALDKMAYLIPTVPQSRGIPRLDLKMLDNVRYQRLVVYMDTLFVLPYF
jgi:hypothetical protein|tara:strand:+ start:349 stop:495 length:147 start_codon:yes stop_codon:yes gene_type:complete